VKVSPAHALLGSTVRKALGLNFAPAHFLEPIVANRGRGLEPLLDITRLEDSAFRCRVRPHTGEAICP
jgi:hypothetical protein